MHADLRGLNPKEELEVEGFPGIFKDMRVLEGSERKNAVTTVTNLEVLKMDGLVSWWFDGQAAPSSEWDAEIRRELEEADIIVLMVSTAFLSRPYIRGVELGRAIQRKVAGDAEIFLLVLEPTCAWKQHLAACRT